MTDKLFSFIKMFSTLDNHAYQSKVNELSKDVNAWIILNHELIDSHEIYTTMKTLSSPHGIAHEVVIKYWTTIDKKEQIKDYED